MLINRIICNEEEYSKNLEMRMKASLSDTEYEIERKKVITQGKISYAIEVKLGKESGFDSTVEVNLDSGFGIIR